MSLDAAILARLNTNGQAISVSKALMPRGARPDAAPSNPPSPPGRAATTWR